MIARAWRAIARGVRAEIHGWAAARDIIADIQAPAPAASTPRVPGPAPVPGNNTRPSQVTAAGPRPAAPAPGPELDHDCGPVDIRISLRKGGCIFVWDRRSGQWRQSRHCGRPPFNVAEWEAKLR